MQKKVTIENCLSTTHPELAAQWHPTKNGDLTPYHVTYASNRKCWWKCDKASDHEWCRSLIDRSLRNRGCPFCGRNGGRVVTSTSLVTTHPELVKEWHPNNETRPTEVLSGSHKNVWWRCEKGHEWQASPNNRSKINSTGCPTCPKKSLAEEYPELVKFWHPRNAISSFEIEAHSGRRFWWKCDIAEDHEYDCTVCNRVKTGCPFCAGRRVCKSNCLATTHPELLIEWHEKNELLPTEIVAGSAKRIWWKCKKNEKHIWNVSAFNRKNGSGCPYCKCSVGEKLVESVLSEIGVRFVREWTHEECRHRALLRFDFAIFIEERVIGLIEYQGIQHFEPVSFGSHCDSAIKLEETQKSDKIKREFCKINKIPLLEIEYIALHQESTVERFVMSLQKDELVL